MKCQMWMWYIADASSGFQLFLLQGRTSEIKYIQLFWQIKMLSISESDFVH